MCRLLGAHYSTLIKRQLQLFSTFQNFHDDGIFEIQGGETKYRFANFPLGNFKEISHLVKWKHLQNGGHFFAHFSLNCAFHEYFETHPFSTKIARGTN